MGVSVRCQVKCTRCFRAAGAGPRRGHPLSPLHCYVTILPLLYIFYVYIYTYYILYIYLYIYMDVLLSIYIIYINIPLLYIKREHIYIYTYIYNDYTCTWYKKKVLAFFWCHLFLALTYGSLFSLDLFQYPLLLSHLRSKRDYPRGCGRGRCAGSRRVIHP